MQLETAGEGASRGAAVSIGDEEDDGKYLSVTTLRQQYLDYLTSKMPEIEEQKEARRYYHSAQLTDDERKILERRGQPPVIINAIARKINRIVGLTERVHQDPKAYPRTPKGEAGAEIATASVRYALDANDWKTRDAECVRQCAIEGIAGIEFKLVEGDKGDPDIEVREVLGEDYFYDPASIRYDFNDKQYDGVGKWLDVEPVVEMFPEKEDLIRDLMEVGSELTTYADREFRFINITKKRIRLVEHWYRHRGKWRWAFYISSTLLDQGTSPFFDERGKTMSRFIMWRCAVDHDGDAYGFFRNLKSLQDEKNQRRSRALHASNNRRLILEKGAVDDVEVTRREYARYDGVIEKNPGKELIQDSTQFELEAQLKFLELTNNEIDQFANIDAATMTNGAVGNLSGRAISLLQQPGLAEIGFFLLGYRGWKMRVYRAIWSAQQKYWTSDRWIRVTDDQGLAQFLQINGMDLDDGGQPALVNYLPKLDVDIMLDEGPDSVNMMADTFDVLARMPPGSVPPAVLIELAPGMQNSVKKRLLGLLQAPPPDPAEMLGKKLTLEGMAASNEAARAVARKEDAAATEKEASAIEKRAGAFNNIVTAAAAAAKVGLDAAQAFREDSVTVPIEREAPNYAQALMPEPAEQPMPQMPPPAMPGGPSALPAL